MNLVDIVRDAESSHNKLNKIFRYYSRQHIKHNSKRTDDSRARSNTVRSNTDFYDFDKDGEFQKSCYSKGNKIQAT